LKSLQAGYLGRNNVSKAILTIPAGLTKNQHCIFALMPFTEQEKSEIIAIWNAQVKTARIPELPPYAIFGEMSLEDRAPIWMKGADKTVWVELSDMRQLILTGGSETLTPVLDGDPMIYEVSEIDAGGTIAAIPSLAGKAFFLRRAGYPMKISEYNILSGGGFELITAGDELRFEERFDYQIYHMERTEPGALLPGLGGSNLFTGVEQVTTNKTLTAANVGKLQQIRSGGTRISLSLADLAVQPDYSVTVIEAAISNTVQNRIAPQAGQYIYMNSRAYDEIFIAPGENIWLFKTADGYYATAGDVQIAYRSLAMPTAVYKDTEDMLICEGQELLRVEYPRLWKEVETFGDSLGLVTENTRINNPQRYIGCFTSGNGTTTFRLPNLMGQFLRGLIRPPDTQRPHNGPGGWQDEEIKEHEHTQMLPTDVAGTGNMQTLTNTSQNDEGLVETGKTGKTGGYETRPVNVGVFWAIKF
jgi:hypothetical protein